MNEANIVDAPRVVYHPTGLPGYWCKVVTYSEGQSEKRIVSQVDVPHDIRFGKCQRID